MKSHSDTFTLIERAASYGGWIMGGYPRDLILGKPIRDVDIYVNESKWIEELGDPIIEHFNENSEEYCNQELAGRIQFNTLPYKVDVLLYKERYSPEDIIGHFDIGLCMVAFNNNLKLEVTKEFVKDAENMTLTVFKTNYKNQEAHLEKIKKKYPEYKVINKRFRFDNIIKRIF